MYLSMLVKIRLECNPPHCIAAVWYDLQQVHMYMHNQPSVQTTVSFEVPLCKAYKIVKV